MEMDTSTVPTDGEELNEAVDTTAETGADNSREAAIAAAKAAMAKSPAETDSDEYASHEKAVAAGKKAAEDTDEAQEATPDEAKLKIFMRAKQQAQKTRDSAIEEARQMREQAQREYAEAQTLKREYEQSKQLLSKLRTNPNEAIRELGLHGKDFWEASLAEGQPDPVRDVKQTVESLQKQLEEQRQEYQQWQQQQLQAKQQQAAQQEQHMFLGHIATSKEAYPTLNALYGEDGTDELVAEAYKVAADFHARTGNYPPQEDIAEYLEYKHASRYKRLTAREIAAEGQTRPTQSKRANGSRTLSTAVSTERASGGKSIDSLSDDEKVALARQAAEKAIREYGRGAA